MPSRTATVLLAGVALWTTSFAAAQADLPGDLFTEYYIRETPWNPFSDVIFTIRLDLTAAEQDGNEIAWSITKITLTETGQGNAGDTVWVDDAPEPYTNDGYWWVEHADPAQPQANEFDWLPLFQGTALATNPTVDDMEYEFSGTHYDPERLQLFGGDVGTLSYVFTLAPQDEPEIEGEDEPVEIQGGTFDT